MLDELLWNLNDFRPQSMGILQVDILIFILLLIFFNEFLEVDQIGSSPGIDCLIDIS